MVKLKMEAILKNIEQFESTERDSLLTFRKQGGKVAATCCHFFPVSLLAGLGLRAVRILNGANIKAESAGEKIVRSDVCSYCKTIIGNFLEATSIHAMVDIVIGLITCDQMRRTLERLQADLKIPVFPVQLPATRTPASENYYVAGVQRVMDDLAVYLGRDFQVQAVLDAEEKRHQAATILLDLIWQSRLSPLVMQKLLRLFFITPPANFLRFLEQNRHEFPEFSPRLKLILVGSVNCDGDDAIFASLNQQQVGIIPLNCTGLNALEIYRPHDPLPEQNLIGHLARRYFNADPCIRHRPNGVVYEKIGHVIQRTGAAGIILKTLPFCDLWYTEKQRLRMTFDRPVLVLDAGYGIGTQDRMQSRIDAFLEAILC